MENDEGLPTESPRDDEGADGTPDAASTDRPLGYWLRLVDALITREFARTLDTEGVGRREWMALNVLAGRIEIPGLAERIAQRGGKRLRRLEERGWVAQKGDGNYELTDEGRAAQERLSGLVDGIREKVAGAASPEDFATMTASLEAIARELGGDDKLAWQAGFGARGFGRGFGRPGFGPRFGGFGRGFGRPGFGPDDDEGEGPRGPFPVDGPNWHRGFGPGGDPRHPHGHGNGHGYRYMGGAEGHGHHGHGCDPHGEHAHHEHAHHEHAHHEHPQHRHGGHGGRGKGRRAAEHGYERGFTAGFEAGRREKNDPAA